MFDKGAKINEVARSVRHLAGAELQGNDLIAALQTALGAEVARIHHSEESECWSRLADVHH